MHKRAPPLLNVPSIPVLHLALVNRKSSYTMTVGLIVVLVVALFGFTVIGWQVTVNHMVGE